MAFLNPWMLVGLSGVGIPILIHLLNRYRHRELDWAAMELLRRALVVRSRQIRIEDILILLLRCLAVALIALAMARPTLRTGARWFGREAQVGVVLAIDGSFSIGHRPGVNTRFDVAVGRAREVLKTLDAGNPVTLVLMGKQPRIVRRNIGFDPELFEKDLAQLKPLPERLDLECCLEELEELTAELKAPVRECYVVTDAQATTWQELSDKVTSLPLTSPRGRALRRHFFAPAANLELDRQGRILIPEHLREYAGLDLSSEVLVIGLYNFIELWNPQRWQDQNEQQLAELDEDHGIWEGVDI
mgnify:CR=1 FL=1